MPYRSSVALSLSNKVLDEILYRANKMGRRIYSDVNELISGRFADAYIKNKYGIFLMYNAIEWCRTEEDIACINDVLANYEDEARIVRLGEVLSDIEETGDFDKVKTFYPETSIIIEDRKPICKYPVP